jgi:hypothetical protein
VCLDQFVDHGLDLGDRERGAGVGVHHHGLVDVVAALLERGAHRQLGDVHERPVQRSALRRELPDRDRVDAVDVDPARHLDATSLREIVDQPVVADVSVLEAALAGDERVDVAGRQLALSLDWDRRAVGKARACLLVFLEVLDRTSDVLVDGDPIALDLVVVVHEPGHILRAVLA